MFWYFQLPPAWKYHGARRVAGAQCLGAHCSIRLQSEIAHRSARRLGGSVQGAGDLERQKNNYYCDVCRDGMCLSRGLEMKTREGIANASLVPSALIIEPNCKRNTTPSTDSALR